MKYIKQYEDIRDELKIGDYVICKEEYITDPDAIKENIKLYEKAIELTSNNIGKFVGKEKHGSNLLIQFENVPLELKPYFSAEDEFENSRIMYYREIKDFSPDKESLLIKINSNKYNI
jgi:hypothetical protein